MSAIVEACLKHSLAYSVCDRCVFGMIAASFCYVWTFIGHPPQPKLNQDVGMKNNAISPLVINAIRGFVFVAFPEIGIPAIGAIALGIIN